MATHLIKVVMILKVLLSWPPKIWEELVRMRGALKNYSKDRKRNELVVKGNLQGLMTIMLVLLFPTQWELWKSPDTLWQSPTYSNSSPVTPHLSPCIQPKPSLVWSSCGFSSSLSWSVFNLDIPFPGNTYLVLLAFCSLHSGVYSNNVSPWKVLCLYLK